MNIAVIYGGRSGEHEVSIVSATSIVRHLDKEKYNVYPVGITKEIMDRILGRYDMCNTGCCFIANCRNIAG